MNHQQARDLSRSEKVFWTTCAAPLKEFFEAEEIVATGQHENGLARMLDFAGVDYLVYSAKYGLIPIQFKASFSSKAYRNFVIRRARDNGKATDWHKLQRAQAYETLKPQFYCSCFISSDGSADVAIAYTDDLLKFIDSGRADLHRHDNGTFYTCDWQRLEDSGVKVFYLNRRADYQRRNCA